MKRMVYWVVLLLLGASGALAKNVEEDRSADVALLTWRDPVSWQFGLVYTHLSRSVDMGNIEDSLRGDLMDVAVGLNPWPWLLLYGQVGASKARLDALREEPSNGAGGLLGARVNLWQLYEGVQNTAWRVTLQLAGQYAYRTSNDDGDGDGDIQWSETLVMLPLRYHLTFARTFRNIFMTEFQGVSCYAGPAFSSLDGTWKRREVETDFEETEAFGIVGGVDLWLLDNLAFGARVDWFESTTFQLNVQYRF